MQRSWRRIRNGPRSSNGHDQYCPYISSWFQPFPMKYLWHKRPSQTSRPLMGTKNQILNRIGLIQKRRQIRHHLYHTIWKMEGSHFRRLRYRDYDRCRLSERPKGQRVIFGQFKFKDRFFKLETPTNIIFLTALVILPYWTRSLVCCSPGPRNWGPWRHQVLKVLKLSFIGI